MKSELSNPSYLSSADQPTRWSRYLIVLAPWLIVLFALAMFLLLQKTICLPEGMKVDLPSTTIGDSTQADVTVLVVAASGGTLVFYDDARYLIEDAVAMETLRENLSRALSHTQNKTILALAGKEIKTGELMTFANVASRSGATKVLFAEKHPEGAR